MSETFARSFDFDARNQDIKAFAILYATGDGQRAYEDLEKGEAFFTTAIIEGLRGGEGKTANDNGEITLGLLIKYVEGTVAEAARKAGVEQIPHHLTGGHRPEELVVAKVAPKREAKAASLLAEEATTEVIYWQSIEKSQDPKEFELFLQQFPKGRFTGLAKLRLEKLQRPGANPTSSVAVSVAKPIAAASVPTVSQYLRAGNKSASEGKFPEAEQAFRQAVQLDNNNALCHASLGVILLNERRSKEAEAEYRQAIRLEPRTARWYALLATALADQGRWSEVEIELARAIQLEPNDAQFHKNFGVVLAQQQKWDRAVSELREAVRLEPGNAEYKSILRAYL